MNEILLFIGGAAVGAIIGWLFASRRGMDTTNHAQQLVQLADAKLRESQANAKTDLTALIGPIQTQLQQLAEHNHTLEKNRIGAYENLRTLVDTLKDGQQLLQKETHSLSRALSSPNARGSWGEKQLRNVLEMSGMTSYCDFIEQHTISDDNSAEKGRGRPDVVVRVPGSGMIAIDSKVPLTAFRAMTAAEDDATRIAARQNHAAGVKRHVAELAKKSYWEGLPSPQFVVLFLPGESFLHSALEADENLLDDALAKSVLLATPATLMALLKAVSYGWRQEKLAQNAAAVSNLGRELYGRLSTLVEHWSGVGKALTSAIGAYNKGVGTLETRVLSTARKFSEYGAVEENAELTISPIEEISPRVLTAPELGNGLKDEELRKIG